MARKFASSSVLERSFESSPKTGMFGCTIAVEDMEPKPTLMDLRSIWNFVTSIVE